VIVLLIGKSHQQFVVIALFPAVLMGGVLERIPKFALKNPNLSNVHVRKGLKDVRCEWFTASLLGVVLDQFAAASGEAMHRDRIEVLWVDGKSRAELSPRTCDL
jgi:hypothetical protein